MRFIRDRPHVLYKLTRVYLKLSVAKYGSSKVKYIHSSIHFKAWHFLSDSSFNEGHARFTKVP